uniref:Chemosensory protein n=1 Tax=Blattella germanica TaxID=6973 RepID=A0A109QFS7_BLAGE|nr:chemosensory protein [Blattella germanica]
MRNTEMILEDESDIKKKCTVECLLLGYGMIKDGQLDVTSVLDFAKPMLEHIQQEGGEIDEENLKENISKCSDTVSGEEENCTSSYETWVCLHDVMTKLMAGSKNQE